MERFHLLLTIVVFGGSFCNGQMIERIEGILIMKNIFDQNEEILEHLKGQQEKITSLEDMQRTMMLKFQGQQDKLTTLEEMQRTIEDTLRDQHTENQLCAKQDQLEDFKNTYESGTEEFKASLELSSCTDQLLDFQEMLAKDECEARTDNCSSSSKCTDQLILYKCVCLPGYFGDGFTCTDIDECQRGQHQCQSPKICININGGYECQCPEGYEVEVNGCRDIDECQRGQHQCQSPKICINIDGSYECQCPEGYEVEVNGCRDIDECQRGQHQCQSPSNCINIDGSYECQCPEGYEVEVNGCRDIDKCQRGQHQCQSPKTCINIDGSYECQCTPPYIRDGESCKNDCESPSLHLNGLGCITLIQTGMNWTEARAECKRLGLRLLEDLKVEHLSPLDLHFTPLRRNYSQKTWIGFRDKIWVTSGHSVASELVAIYEGELEDRCGTFDIIRDTDYFGLWDTTCTITYDALCQTIP